MSGADFWKGPDQRIKQLTRNRAEPVDAKVIEIVGSKARVAFPGESEDPLVNTRPEYPVVGALPTVGQQVLVLANFAGGWIITSGGGAGGAHGDTHVSTGTDPVPDAVAGGASGLLSGTDKTKLNGLSSQAIGAFRVYSSTDQLDIPDRTFTKVNFGTEEYDVGGWFATSRYTPQKAGYYDLGAGVTITPAVADQRFYVILYKNGARYADLAVAHTSTTLGLGLSGATPRIYANGTTDYFEIYVFHTFGVNTSDLTGTSWTTYFNGGFAGE